jgi:hypothetical protein
VGQLDKPEAAIIDHAACPQRLDSGALQNHLRALGLSAALGGLRRGPAAAKEPFRRPALARAEEGLLHVMGVLRERDEVRTGFDRNARRLQRSLRPKRWMERRRSNKSTPQVDRRSGWSLRYV